MSALCVQCNAGVTVDIGRCLFVGGDNHLSYVCQVSTSSLILLCYELEYQQTVCHACIIVDG